MFDNEFANLLVAKQIVGCYDVIYDQLKQYNPDDLTEFVYSVFKRIIMRRTTISIGDVVALLNNKNLINNIPLTQETYMYITRFGSPVFAPYISKIRRLTDNSAGMYIPCSPNEVKKYKKFGFDPSIIILPENRTVELDDQGLREVLGVVLRGRANVKEYLRELESEEGQLYYSRYIDNPWARMYGQSHIRKIYFTWKDRDGITRYLFPSDPKTIEDGTHNLQRLASAAGSEVGYAEYTTDFPIDNLNSLKLMQIVYSFGGVNYDSVDHAWKAISEYSSKQRGIEEKPKKTATKKSRRKYSSDEEELSEEEHSDDSSSVERTPPGRSRSASPRRRYSGSEEEELRRTPYRRRYSDSEEEFRRTPPVRSRSASPRRGYPGSEEEEPEEYDDFRRFSPQFGRAAPTRGRYSGSEETEPSSEASGED